MAEFIKKMVVEMFKSHELLEKKKYCFETDFGRKNYHTILPSPFGLPPLE